MINMSWKRVLIIDDNQDSVDLMKYALTKANFYPVPARSCAEAIRLVEKDPPALIVCDLRMPAVDGIECARKIRAIYSLKDVPMVLVTDKPGEPGDAAKATEAGFNGYLQKPMDPYRLVDLLRAFMK